jgi:hypothetical protein
VTVPKEDENGIVGGVSASEIIIGFPTAKNPGSRTGSQNCSG